MKYETTSLTLFVRYPIQLQQYGSFLLSPVAAEDLIVLQLNEGPVR